MQFCGTTPCRLRGADAIEDVCRIRIGEQGHVTADGKFSWVEVECLGACVNAPMVQINADYYEDLTQDSFLAVLDALAAGKTPRARPASGPAIVGAGRRRDHAHRPLDFRQAPQGGRQTDFGAKRQQNEEARCLRHPTELNA